MRSLASALVLGLTAACTPIQLHMGVSPELLAKGRALETPIVVLQHETSHHLVWREYHWDVVVEEHKVILLNSDGGRGPRARALRGGRGPRPARGACPLPRWAGA